MKTYDPMKVWTWPKEEREAYARKIAAYLADVEDPGEQNEPPFCTEHRRYACSCQQDTPR